MWGLQQQWEVQNDVCKNSEGKYDHEKQEITSGNSEDKSDEGKYSQINNEVVLWQHLHCDSENEHSKDNTDDNQSESNKDKIVVTCRTSSRTKKIPSTRSEDLLWWTRHTLTKMI
jgi:hypothetical protein